WCTSEKWIHFRTSRRLQSMRRGCSFKRSSKRFCARSYSNASDAATYNEDRRYRPIFERFWHIVGRRFFEGAVWVNEGGLSKAVFLRRFINSNIHRRVRSYDYSWATSCCDAITREAS